MSEAKLGVVRGGRKPLRIQGRRESRKGYVWPGLQRLSWLSELESLTGTESELGSLAPACFGLANAPMVSRHLSILLGGREGHVREGQRLAKASQ